MSSFTLTWLLLALGLLFLVAEAFVPSGGVLGILSLVSLGGSLLEAFRVSNSLGLTVLAAEAVLIPVAGAGAVYIWPKTPLARRILLKPPTPEEFYEPHPAGRLDLLIGEPGRTLSPLRPSGSVEFDGRRLEGLAEQGFIPAGTAVVAMKVRSGQLIVRPITDPQRDPPLTPSESPA